MPRSVVQLVAVAWAAVLGIGGLTLLPAPASAQVFPGISTLDDFVVALATANANGEPDTIEVAVAAEEIWTYTGTLDVVGDLTIALAPGSAGVTFRSSDASAFTLGAGVEFSASGVGFTGLGDAPNSVPGHGIDAPSGAAVVLDSVALTGSSDDGIHLVGGSLTASSVAAGGNGGDGMHIEDVATADLDDVVATGNGGGVSLILNGGTAAIDALAATGNATHGLAVSAVGGTATVQDSQFTANGSLLEPGNGVTVSAAGGAAVTLAGVTIDGNVGISGGGLWVDEIVDASTVLTLRDSTVTQNRALAGGGIGVGNTAGSYAIDGGGRFVVENSTIAANSSPDAGGGIAIVGIGPESGFSLVRSTVRDNVSEEWAGGGLALVGLGGEGEAVVIDASTISGNQGALMGGVLLECDELPGVPTVRLTNATLSGNTGNEVAGTLGAGCEDADDSVSLELLESTVTDGAGDAEPAVYLLGNELTMRNSLIGGNANALDLVLDESTAQIDYSLIQNPDPAAEASVAAGVGNIMREAPQLGPLDDNGGPTRTHLPVEGGNLAEAGDPSFAPPPELDQRGEPRVSGRLDIGSVELQRPPDVLPATGGPVPSWLLFLAVVMLGGGAVALARRLDPHR